MKQSGVILFFFFFSKTYSQNANQTIMGIIIDQDSKQPIAGATVNIANSNPNHFSDQCSVGGSIVPLYHIASYLGVKPESLSRIRGRLRSSSSKLPNK